MQKKYLDKIFSLSRTKKLVLALFFDSLFFYVSTFIAIASTFRYENKAVSIEKLILTILINYGLTLGVFLKLGLYREIIRYINYQFLAKIIASALLSSLSFYSLVYLGLSLPSIAFISIYTLSLLLFILCSRLLINYYWFFLKNYKLKNIAAVYGVGEAGQQILSLLLRRSDVKIEALIDDDPSYSKSIIQGKPVYHSSKLKDVLHKYKISKIILAIPSAKPKRRSEIIENLSQFKELTILTIPSIDAILSGNNNANTVQPLEIEDLLGRDRIPPDKELMKKCIEGRNVLISGAGGSIGSEIARQTLLQEPSILVLLEITEFALYSITEQLKLIKEKKKSKTKIISILGSVLDKVHIDMVLKKYSIDSIYHAAAYKHVPLVEQNISEGVKNNTIGTLTLAQCALENHIKNFVLISSDKAVRPTNVMGASKRMAELAINYIANQNSLTTFSIVRFGNVLGSSGSVVPLFKEQIKRRGPLTITHPEISRYFMTLNEAAELVLQANAMASNGDIFVLDMGKPVKILDLAMKMLQLSGSNYDQSNIENNEIKIVFTGLRPGEKLYEELFIEKYPQKTEHKKILKINERKHNQRFIKKILNDLKIACEHKDDYTVLEILHKSPIDYEVEKLTLEKHNRYLLCKNLNDQNNIFNNM